MPSEQEIQRLIKCLYSYHPNIRENAHEILVEIGEHAITSLIPKLYELINEYHPKSTGITLHALTIIKINSQKISDAETASFVLRVGGRANQITELREGVVDCLIHRIITLPTGDFRDYVGYIAVLMENGVKIDCGKMRNILKEQVKIKSKQGNEEGKRAVEIYRWRYSQIINVMRRRKQLMTGILSEGKLQPPKGSKRLVRVRRIRNG